MTDTTIVTFSPTINTAILAWLDAKGNKSGSAKTHRAYVDTLGSFRAYLLARNLDLDGEERAVTLLAQAWAGQGTRGRSPSAATFNQRLAIVSSFYSYAHKQRLLVLPNPIELVERRTVESYAQAQPLPPAIIQERLQAIVPTTLIGARDRAVLMVGLQCGRRRSELAALRWGDVELANSSITLHWRHCKGGKTMHDAVPPSVGQALRHWLNLFYGTQLPTLPADAPIWVSLSSNASWGQALDTQSFGDICLHYLGTSKVHTLRHTFAVAMEQAGAPIRTIQARLGHTSIRTTEIYLSKLTSADNAFADALSTLFGFGD